VPLLDRNGKRLGNYQKNKLIPWVCNSSRHGPLSISYFGFGRPVPGNGLGQFPVNLPTDVCFAPLLPAKRTDDYRMEGTSMR